MEQLLDTRKESIVERVDKPRVVFVDWYGTLSSSVFWDQLKDEDNPDHYIFQAVQKYLFGELREVLTPWMRGEYTTEQIIERLSNESGISAEILLTTLEESCRSMVFTSEKVLPLVHQLRDMGVKVVIATDNMDTFNRWTVPSLQLDDHFDDVLNSYDLSARKSDFDIDGTSKFFKEYLAALDIKPNETMIFDDSTDKDGRIQNLGIQYVQIPFHTGLEPALQGLIDHIITPEEH